MESLIEEEESIFNCEDGSFYQENNLILDNINENFLQNLDSSYQGSVFNSSLLDESYPQKFKSTSLTGTTHDCSLNPLTISELFPSFNSFLQKASFEKSVNETINQSLDEKKKGRKKFLLDGFKREIADKAFLRQFKLFLSETKILNSCWDKLQQEEKLFWREFFEKCNPPFTFTVNGEKKEFKSFSQKWLSLIFSFKNVVRLYEEFTHDKLFNRVFDKKMQKLSEKHQLMLFYYGKNIHRLYSNETIVASTANEEFQNASFSLFAFKQGRLFPEHGVEDKGRKFSISSFIAD